MQRVTLRLSASVHRHVPVRDCTQMRLNIVSRTDARRTDVFPENVCNRLAGRIRITRYTQLLQVTTRRAKRDERATVRRRNAIFTSETNIPVLIYRYRFAKYQLALDADYVNNNSLLHIAISCYRNYAHATIEFLPNPGYITFHRTK